MRRERKTCGACRGHSGVFFVDREILKELLGRRLLACARFGREGCLPVKTRSLVKVTSLFRPADHGAAHAAGSRRLSDATRAIRTTLTRSPSATMGLEEDCAAAWTNSDDSHAASAVPRATTSAMPMLGEKKRRRALTTTTPHHTVFTNYHRGVFPHKENTSKM